MNRMIYQQIVNSSLQGQKQLAVLIDPDKTDEEGVINLANLVKKHGVDFVFVGGSLLTGNFMGTCLKILKELLTIPIVIFPGNTMQVHKQADGILLLSLISGRNPELLIGNHVIAAPQLQQSGLEIIPTGYMLIESGCTTSVAYMSNTTPIPHDKNDIAVCTAMAGEMLGLKLLYADAGSGAKHTISANMVQAIKDHVKIPLIIGGGIGSALSAQKVWEAGADLIVVGNALEKQPGLIEELTDLKNRINKVNVG